MIVIPHNEKMLKKASTWSKKLGGLPNSITKGAGNIAGRLGELAVAEYLGVKIEDKKDYDLVYNGERLEVKTKRRTVAPRWDYDVSVATTSTHQHPDRYVFVSLEFERKEKWEYFGLKNVWLCGDKDAVEYMEKAFLHKMGSTDWTNGFKTIVDMWNMRIHDLDQTIRA